MKRLWLIVLMAILSGCDEGGSYSNTPPVAEITNYGLGLVDTTYILKGDTSSDADGDSLDRRWLLLSKPAGSLARLVPVGGNVSFTPDRPGNYRIELTVSDGRDTDVHAVTFIAATPYSGTLSNSVALTTNYSPYMITSDVTIPSGQTLTVDPGVTVYAARVARDYAPYESYAKIYVDGGKLSVNGATDARVRLYDTRIEATAAQVNIGFTDVFFTHLDTGEAMLVGADSISTVYGKTVIRDSSFLGSVSLQVDTPDVTSYLERNIFGSSTAVYVYTDETYQDIYVTNNLFDESTLYVQSALVQSVHVALNSFLPSTTKYSLYMEEWPDPGYLEFSARYNYWGTTNPDAIAAAIRDGHVNGGYSDYVLFDPFLSSPDSETPSF